MKLRSHPHSNLKVITHACAMQLKGGAQNNSSAVRARTQYSSGPGRVRGLDLETPCVVMVIVKSYSIPRTDRCTQD